MKTHNIFTIEEYKELNDRMLFAFERVGFKPLTIKIGSYRKDKTPRQMRKYWALVNQIVKHLKKEGIETNSESLHEAFKSRIDFTENIILPNGESLHYTKSIKKMNLEATSKVMNELIEYTQRWAAENLNLYLD